MNSVAESPAPVIPPATPAPVKPGKPAAKSVFTEAELAFLASRGGVVVKPVFFKGWLITRNTVNGFYSAWKSGELRLRADTLSGLKQLIREGGAK